MSFDLARSSFADSSSPITLSLGGSGIVLSTLIPLVSMAVDYFPVPYDFSWLNQFGRPLPTLLSAAMLVVAATILAIGVRTEPGIVGRSNVGKLSLILFGLAGLGLDLIAPASLSPLGTSPVVLAVISIGLWSAVGLQLAALSVASVIVFRAGVIRGAARHGLVALAVVTALTLAVNNIPAIGLFSLWGHPIELLLMLAIGLLYLIQGRKGAAIVLAQTLQEY